LIPESEQAKAIVLQMYPTPRRSGPASSVPFGQVTPAGARAYPRRPTLAQLSHADLYYVALPLADNAVGGDPVDRLTAYGYCSH
jgi:hypothetical protein